MKKLHILIVDDEENLSAAVALEVEYLGHTYKTAKEGEEALKLIKNNSFDLVISDIRMPKMDGIKLLESIWSTYGLKLPVILMTGFTNIPVWETYSKGCCGFLGKPFLSEDLDKLISSVYCSIEKKWDSPSIRKNEKKFVFTADSIDELKTSSKIEFGIGGFSFVDTLNAFKRDSAIEFTIEVRDSASDFIDGTGFVRWTKNISKNQAIFGVEFEMLTVPSGKNLDLVQKNEHKNLFIPVAKIGLE